MTFLLKKAYETYFYVMNDLADPRSNEYFLLRTPIPTLVIFFVWYKFIFEWGPTYMKNRPPFNLKKIMMVYNIGQVIANGYIAYYTILGRNALDWRCAPMDYSDEYWPRKFHSLGHMYYALKLADLLDTVFFVLRKKSSHLSFLHIYHHSMMALFGWFGAKFLGGGHSYFVALANSIVHTILYSYYLLTAYNSQFSQWIWLKKFITQAQLAQFVFILFIYGRLLFIPDCSYPRAVLFLLIPQNVFMIVLFSNFYVRTYIMEPKRKQKLLEEQKNNQVKSQ